MRPFSRAVHNSCITGFDFNFNLSYSWTSSEHCSLFPVRFDSNKGSAGPARKWLARVISLRKGNTYSPAIQLEMDRNYKLWPFVHWKPIDSCREAKNSIWSRFAPLPNWAKGNFFIGKPAKGTQCPIINTQLCGGQHRRRNSKKRDVSSSFVLASIWNVETVRTVIPAE